MSSSHKPFIAAEQKLPEITIKGILLAVILAAILAMSNAYLALKIGILTSASIPAAVISMGVLRFFKQSNVLENNLVQTAASAGQAVAGGIVYTVPALIIIQYWHGFHYWENLFIALIGGLLGVFFSIPLRRILVREKKLLFPEGRAIAELLKTSTTKIVGFTEMLWGGVIGGVLELCQTGFKLIANSWQYWFNAKGILVGVGIGFSPTMIGAGYLIGFNIASSILVGALLNWFLGIPVASYLQLPAMTSAINDPANTTMLVSSLWSELNRYVAIGAMLVAGVWTLSPLAKLFAVSLFTSLQAIRQRKNANSIALDILRTERDIPMGYVLLSLIALIISLFVFFYFYLPVFSLGLSQYSAIITQLCAVIYVVVVGFIISTICAYFSGLVGMSAAPGSAVIIAGMLLAAILLFTLLEFLQGAHLSHEHVLAAEAITIIVGAVITGSAAISLDNIQDLKVGHILGATPWRQQVMLILGVIVSAAIIPPTMQLLFNVYGIAGVMPHAGMDAAQSLPAPPAAMMAAVTQAVFRQNLPWHLLWLGGGLMLALILLNSVTQRVWGYSLSILGIAVGMYLPLASSTPLFIGGLMALITQRSKTSKHDMSKAVLLACGLVAGSALTDVLLAIPFSVAGNSNVLRLMTEGAVFYPVLLAFCVVFGLGSWFYRVTR